MSTPLDAARIHELCVATRNGLAIDVTASTGSTNADLRQRLDALRTPLLLAAEEQTAGRGRAGRSWLAAPGDSLCFSLAWPFAGAVTRLAGLPLAIGVALVDLLRAHRWNISAVARQLGVARMTVYRRMQRAGIVAPQDFAH